MGDDRCRPCGTNETNRQGLAELGGWVSGSRSTISGGGSPHWRACAIIRSRRFKIDAKLIAQIAPREPRAAARHAQNRPETAASPPSPWVRPRPSAIPAGQRPVAWRRPSGFGAMDGTLLGAMRCPRGRRLTAGPLAGGAAPAIPPAGSIPRHQQVGAGRVIRCGAYRRRQHAVDRAGDHDAAPCRQSAIAERATWLPASSGAGVAPSSISADGEESVAVAPGHSVVTLTPVPRSSKRGLAKTQHIGLAGE